MNVGYNTAEGIESYLNDLDGLHRLIRDRHRAGELAEQLDEFIVLGRYRLDSYGNHMILVECTAAGGVSADWIPRGFPRVIKCDRLSLLPDLSMTWSIRVVPSAEARCVECGDNWTVDDADDCEPDESWAGPPAPRSLRHKACARLARHRRSYEAFDAIAQAAGFVRPVLVPVANGYDKSSGEPWFELRTRRGNIVIGWRKRVIQLDWSDVLSRELDRLTCGIRDWSNRQRVKESTHARLDADRLFASENVTKGGSLIHAWGPEKATEYLKKLRSTMTTIG